MRARECQNGGQFSIDFNCKSVAYSWRISQRRTIQSPLSFKCNVGPSCMCRITADQNDDFKRYKMTFSEFFIKARHHACFVQRHFGTLFERCIVVHHLFKQQHKSQYPTSEPVQKEKNEKLHLQGELRKIGNICTPLGYFCYLFVAL